jgi:hypothetical protein
MIPKKYIIQEKKNKGKLNQTALQVKLKTNNRGQPHPKVKGLVLIRYTSDRPNTQKWGTKEQYQSSKVVDSQWGLNNREAKRKHTADCRKRNPHMVKITNEKSRRKRRENGKCKAYRSTAEYQKRSRENNRVYKKKNMFICSTRTRYGKLIPKLDRHWEVDEILGGSDKEVRTHIEKQFKDGMSWDNFGEWHLDHVIPCKAKIPLTDEYIFDLTKPSHQKLCFNYQNLQPLWESENCSKQNKIHWSIILTLLVNNYKTIGLKDD